jgi:hypothetical protein
MITNTTEHSKLSNCLILFIFQNVKGPFNMSSDFRAPDKGRIFVITNYFQVRYVFILKSCRTIKNYKIKLRILFLHRFVSIFIEFFSRIKDLCGAYIEWLSGLFNKAHFFQ